jgi:conjugative relaxase-like TrwC/TraI family protein
MLSISTPMKAAGRANYYMGGPAEKYYLEGTRQAGRWFGQAVELLGLPERVSRRTFHNLLNGFSPDGRRPLVQNAGDPNRASCWDLTFSAPKSVSVLWAIAPPDIRHQIEQAHHVAVQHALAHMEAVAGITRRGKGGALREHGKLVFATFFEGTSRALDPAMHTHAALINLALRQDGTTGTLHTRNLFDAKMRAGALYRDELAAQLRQELGLVIDPDPVGFHLRGVPRNLCEIFSTRRRAVVKALQAHGLEGAVAAKMMTLLTRPKKSPQANANHFERWREVAQQCGWGQEQARQLVEEGRQTWTQAPASDQQQVTPNETHSETVASPEGRPKHEQTHAPPDPNREQSDQSQPHLDQELAQPERSSTESAHPPRSQPGDAGAKQDSRRQDQDRDRNRAQRALPDGEAVGRAPARSDNSGANQNRRRQDRDQKNSQRKHHEDTRAQTGSNARDGYAKGPAETRRDGFRMEWRRLFPKAPFWSLAQFVKVPWLVFPEPKSPWGSVQWHRQGRLGAVYIQERKLFPNAPEWSPLHNLKQSAVRVVPAKWLLPQKPLPRWWSIHYKLSLPWGEFRVQDRHLFRFAPRWNPLRKLTLPALRFTTKRSKWVPREVANAERDGQENMRMSP